MAYGAILEKGENFHTHLKRIFDAINNVQKDYNWLITDCECCPKNEHFCKLFSKDYIFLSGEELTEIIEAEDFQWIWAIFSGFDKSIPLEEIIKYPLPDADGCGSFWEKNPVKIQHPLASIEIVAFDSCLTLFISEDEKTVSDFRKYFPLSEDLFEYNPR